MTLFTKKSLLWMLATLSGINLFLLLFIFLLIRFTNNSLRLDVNNNVSNYQSFLNSCCICYFLLAFFLFLFVVLAKSRLKESSKVFERTVHINNDEFPADIYENKIVIPLSKAQYSKWFEPDLDAAPAAAQYTVPVAAPLAAPVPSYYTSTSLATPAAAAPNLPSTFSSPTSSTLRTTTNSLSQNTQLYTPVVSSSFTSNLQKVGNFLSNNINNSKPATIPATTPAAPPSTLQKVSNFLSNNSQPLQQIASILQNTKQ